MNRPKTTGTKYEPAKKGRYKLRPGQKVLVQNKNCLAGYFISRIQNSARSALQTGLYKGVTARKTYNVHRTTLFYKKLRLLILLSVGVEESFKIVVFSAF